MMKYPFYSIPSDHKYGLTHRKFESFIYLSIQISCIYLSVYLSIYSCRILYWYKQKLKYCLKLYKLAYFSNIAIAKDINLSTSWLLLCIAFFEGIVLILKQQYFCSFLLLKGDSDG